MAQQFLLVLSSGNKIQGKCIIYTGQLKVSFIAAGGIYQCNWTCGKLFIVTFFCRLAQLQYLVMKFRTGFSQGCLLIRPVFFCS